MRINRCHYKNSFWSLNWKKTFWSAFSLLMDCIHFLSYTTTNIFRSESFLERLGVPKVNQCLASHIIGPLVLLIPQSSLFLSLMSSLGNVKSFTVHELNSFVNITWFYSITPKLRYQKSITVTNSKLY